MSFADTLEKFLGLDPLRGHPVREFLGALRVPRTYTPWSNAYSLFGFLWGLPIPFFSVAIDAWASGRPFGPALIVEHPVHLLFVVHPFLFAVVFGAMGSVRHMQDHRITHLLAEVERHALDLEIANDKLKELDRLKGEFMANVTHELKTPLVAIRGYNESILEGRFGPVADKQREGLQVAVRNVDRLQRLIEELLEFQRIESGRLRLDPSDFDLVPLIRAALATFEPQIAEKALLPRIEIPETLPVHADREKIARVLLNLVSNAVKFTSRGAAVGVRTETGGGHARVSVWDEGPGIPQALHPHLFTRFWQAEGSARRLHGGTGLGLAIVKGILDAHGEKIVIDSAEGNGTTARFGLPLAPAMSRVGREEAP